MKPNAELGLEPGAIPETFTFIWQHEYFYFIFKKVKSICINIISATEDTDLNQLSFKMTLERYRVVFYTCYPYKTFCCRKVGDIVPRERRKAKVLARKLGKA